MRRTNVGVSRAHLTTACEVILPFFFYMFAILKCEPIESKSECVERDEKVRKNETEKKLNEMRCAFIAHTVCNSLYKCKYENNIFFFASFWSIHIRQFHMSKCEEVPSNLSRQM